MRTKRIAFFITLAFFVWAVSAMPITNMLRFLALKIF